MQSLLLFKDFLSPDFTKWPPNLKRGGQKWPPLCQSWIEHCRGVLRKIFDGVVRLRFSIGYPWLRKFWSKTYPWLRRISWWWAHSYVILRNFSPNISLLREIFQKKKHNLAPKCPFLGVTGLAFSQNHHLPDSKNLLAPGRRAVLVGNGEPWVIVKNVPLAKDFGRQIYPWLRNLCQKYTLG